MAKFITSDSGERVRFATGSQRDTAKGKTRYDLIPVTSLTRLADLYARGAEKYDDWNWSKGQPFSRLYESALRHLIEWRQGQADEDHLAAVAWNVFALLHFDEVGRTDLDDLLPFDDLAFSESSPKDNYTNLAQNIPYETIKDSKK